jgi:phosphonate transport system substrate-binding protein
MKAKLFLLFIICIAAILSGCNNGGDLDKNGVPHKLVFGMFGGDKPGQTKEAMEPIRAYLQKRLGLDVEFIFTTDYTSVIEALRTKKIEAAELGPFAYVIATQKPGVVCIATLGRNGLPSLYHSSIFTNPGTGIKTMDDVKKRSKSLTLCFADPASTSGHLIPRAYLTSIGLDPQNAFKQVMFSGSHAASLLNVQSGKVDIGCSTADLEMEKLIREGMAKRNDFVVLWVSPPIISNAIAIRQDLNKDFIKKVQDAFVNMAKDDPAAFNSYAKLYYANTQGMSYIAAKDSMYDGLRKIAATIPQFKAK